MPTTSLFLARLIIMFLLAVLSFAVIDGNAAGWVLLIGTVATVTNALVGDLFTLPRFGNVITSFGEGGLAALGAYILSLIFTPITVSPTGLIVFGILAGAGEYLLHKYLHEPEVAAP